MDRRTAIRALVALPTVKTIEVAQLKPNDVIVMQCSEHVTEETAARIRAYAENVWPGHKVVVLGDGLSMRIMRSGEE